MMFLRYESLKDYLRLYPVTSAILFINLLLFVLMTFTGGSENTENLIRYGAQITQSPYNELSQAWRYITAMFLHIGFQHVLFNCFAIFVFAPPLERILGSLRYSIIYLGSGLAGNLLTELFAALLGASTLSAGASGAIFGIYAAYLYIGLIRKDLLDQQSYKTIMIILAVGLIYSFMPRVNIYAHLGGFIGGFALFPLLLKLKKR